MNFAGLAGLSTERDTSSCEQTSLLDDCITYMWACKITTDDRPGNAMDGTENECI